MIKLYYTISQYTELYNPTKKLSPIVFVRDTRIALVVTLALIRQTQGHEKLEVRGNDIVLLLIKDVQGHNSVIIHVSNMKDYN
jgi:hypothetical protein